MSHPFLFVLAMQATGAAEPARLVVTPGLLQNAVLHLADDVTAGGLGGGVALQLRYDDRYLAQVDASMLFGIGKTASTRLAIGVQHRGTWSPAGWISLGALWGDRVEILDGVASRPPFPSWAVGLRASPLRFTFASGHVSALEPGLATNVSGGLWFELTVLQAGASF